MVKRPLLAWIVYDIPRDCAGSDEVRAYLEGVRRAVDAARATRGLPRGPASVYLRLSETGDLLSTSPSETLSADSYAALASGLADAAPFQAPPAHLRDCLVDSPVLFQVVVP